MLLRDGFPKVLLDHVQSTGNLNNIQKTIGKENIMFEGLNVNATQQTSRCVMSSVSSSAVSAFQVLPSYQLSLVEGYNVHFNLSVKCYLFRHTPEW